MSKIDKRKFLTELSKLLTLMYEEDSRTAIAMYERMFSECTDERALISFFGSPTKQAVALARCYNSKEKNLGVRSEHGAGDAAVASGRTPEFVRMINDIREEAVSAGLIYAVQPVYFDNDVPGEEAVLPAEEDHTPARETRAVALPANDFDFSGITPASEKETGSLFEETPDFAAGLADSFGNLTLDLGPAVTAGKAVSVSPAEEDDYDGHDDYDTAEETSTYTVDENQFTMDGFDTYLNGSAPAAGGDRPAGAGSKPARSEKGQPVKGAEKAVTGRGSSDASKPVTINIAVVVLYLLVAVPVTAAGVLLLLVPALLFLALAVVAGTAAFNVISTAFGSFAIFADILVVLGAGLLLSAFALLFLLLFGWFIGCAIAGLINGAIRLGGRICCREGGAS